MHKKTVSGIMLTLLLVSLFPLAINVKPTKSTWTGTVYIRADGSIDPSDAPITTCDNITYKLTDNIISDAHGIVVERDNIVIDGANHKIQGPLTYESTGIRLIGITNVTIKNINIIEFGEGILLNNSSKSRICRNNIRAIKDGMSLINSFANLIYKNNISGGFGYGIRLSYFSSNNRISQNVISGSLWFSGIGVFGLSNNNVISANNIVDSYEGIRLEHSSNNSIIRNNLTNNNHGIILDFCSDNDISQNFFLNNTLSIELFESVFNNVSGNGINSFETGDGIFSLASGINFIAYNDLNSCKNGIFLSNSNYTSIIGNKIINSDSKGIYLFSSFGNNVIDNYLFSNKIGISLNGSLESRIYHNNFIGNKLYGISLYYSSNNNITENDITNSSIGILLVASPNSEVLENYVRNVEGGIYLSNSPSSTVLRNNVSDCHGIPIPVKKSPNSKIIGNIIMKSVISPAVPYDGGIFLIESNNSIVQENEIIENNHGGIWLFSSHCCRVQGNMVRDNHGRGSAIYLHLSEGCTVHNNEVVNNTGNGIEFYSNSTIITKNTISDNTIAGIAFLGQNNTLFANNISNHHGFFGAGVIVGSGSINNVIISNNLYENDIGIWFDGEPDASVFNNTVSNNLIVGNGKGLRLDYSHSSTIHFNALINNEYGIYLLESYGNYIYHNNFINNTEQVYDPSWEYPDVSPSVNFWDDGYPSGGNYWSDYNGTDFYSGPFQNEPGSDGIGDTPYVIDENNVDHYPLMTPYAITPPVPSVINAIVDVNPKALNLRSKGKWITAYIELPEGYNVSDIDVSTIMLNDTISAEPKPIAVGNHDEDGILDLMIKFDRANVISYILANVNKTKLFDERFIAVTLTITGYLNDGTLFQGTTTIRVLMPIPFFVSRHWRFCRTLQIFPI